MYSKQHSRIRREAARRSMSDPKIEQRIAALEASLEEIKKLKGIPGPRGPAGHIDAAVANANQAVADAESRVQARTEATYAKFATDVKALREEVKQLQQYLDSRITDAVDNATIQVLRDYHLLNENHEPTHWKK
jgi:hypothetical protein